MIFQNQSIKNIILPEDLHQELVDHALRKMDANYLPGETPERKAYGFIGGKIIDEDLHIGKISPLSKNSRTIGDDKKYMDVVLDEYAEASETPLDKRGWVADAQETITILNTYADKGLELVATYHMHRVAWEHDLTRELPTTLDTILAKDTELFTFIIATINTKAPVIRAFYESYPDKEINIIVESQVRQAC